MMEITEDELTQLLMQHYACYSPKRTLKYTDDEWEQQSAESRRLARLMLASEKMYELLNVFANFRGFFIPQFTSHEFINGCGCVGCATYRLFDKADSALAAAEGRK